MYNFAGPVFDYNIQTDAKFYFVMALLLIFALITLFTILSWPILLVKKLRHKKSPKLLKTTKITTGIIFAVYIVFLIVDNT